MNHSMHETRREVPIAALRMPAGVCHFAIGQNAAATDEKVPVRLVARTGQPIEHWYWGLIVHDLAGLKLHKPSLPLDYCHDPGEVLGYVDHFDTQTGDLVCSGALVPFDANDRAAEIVHKARAGVPYESSIAFDPDNIVVENVPAGRSVEVNGYTLNGPAVVFREWSLRGVAICPHGYDKHTPVELDRNATVQLSLLTWESPMSAPTPAAMSGVTAGKDHHDQHRAELQRFVAAFGAEHGSQWYLEGRTFADACALRLDALGALSRQQADEIAALSAERDDLKRQVSAVTAEKATAEAELTKLRAENELLRRAEGRGEPMPVSGGDAGAARPAGTPIGGLSQGLAAFAAALKLPSQ